MMIRLFTLMLIVMVCAACNNQGNQQDNPNTIDPKPKKTVVFPQFDSDSAFAFVKAQTDFGPRVPNTEAHEQCADWLVSKLSEYADTVIVQQFRTRLYDNTSIVGKNIIASFNPKAKKRIILCSHWDSRPFADEDPNEANWNHPIDGANDGASGVGVLIENARCFHNHPLDEKTGVDIILFDLEDYGPRRDQAERYNDNRRNYWALGSQYWASQHHIIGYKAYYGILLDMVGNSNPNFMKEYYSQGYAAWLSNKVWSMAQSLGYSHCFVNDLGDPISDDHLPLNEIARIPTIDIIDLRPQDEDSHSFPETWHTLDDNIDHIDKYTLQIVGNVLIHTVYNE